MKDVKKYSAIIPKNVRYNPKLKASEKLLFGEIAIHISLLEVCFYTNKMLARETGFKKETISRMINNLIKEDYIKIGKCPICHREYHNLVDDGFLEFGKKINKEEFIKYFKSANNI